MKDYSRLIALVRILVGAIFLFSAVSKIKENPATFAYHLEGYRLFPDWFLMPFAKLFPWAELLLGLSLATGFHTREAGYAATGLFGLFTSILLLTILRGINLENCGCFGDSGPHFSPLQTAGMDSLLLMASLWVAADGGRAWSLDAYARPSFQE